MQDEYDFSSGKRGAVADTSGKTRMTLFLDDDIVTAFRERAAASGTGCQTLINEALRASLAPDAAPLTVATLRQVLHEMLPAA
jgi:uncharacterized protein (DUF4415 family)